MTRAPVARSVFATRCANNNVYVFSILPLLDLAPGSLPPCPGSKTIVASDNGVTLSNGFVRSSNQLATHPVDSSSRRTWYQPSFSCKICKCSPCFSTEIGVLVTPRFSRSVKLGICTVICCLYSITVVTETATANIPTVIANGIQNFVIHANINRPSFCMLSCPFSK